MLGPKRRIHLGSRDCLGSIYNNTRLFTALDDFPFEPHLLYPPQAIGPTPVSEPATSTAVFTGVLLLAACWKAAKRREQT